MGFPFGYTALTVGQGANLSITKGVPCPRSDEEDLEDEDTESLQAMTTVRTGLLRTK